MTARNLLLGGGLLLSATMGIGHAARCLENRDFQQNLPAEIGREDMANKYVFALQCDTVFVRKGVTTTVHSGTYLYFAKTSLNSVIKVEGTLILRGTKNSYVYLSGSLDSSKNGYEPGQKPWGGIEISEGGKLIMEFVGMARAPTPITAFSRQVSIVNSFFKGSSGMILPDGSLMAMDPKWQAINNLNLDESKDSQGTKPPTAGAGGGASEDGLSKDEKAELLGKKDRPFWTWKKAAGGAALVAVAVGAGIYLAPGDDKPATHATPKVNTLDHLPPAPDGTVPE